MADKKYPSLGAGVRLQGWILHFPQSNKTTAVLSSSHSALVNVSSVVLVILAIVHQPNLLLSTPYILHSLDDLTINHLWQRHHLSPAPQHHRHHRLSVHDTWTRSTSTPRRFDPHCLSSPSSFPQPPQYPRKSLEPKVDITPPQSPRDANITAVTIVHRYTTSSSYSSIYLHPPPAPAPSCVPRHQPHSLRGSILATWRWTPNSTNCLDCARQIIYSPGKYLVSQLLIQQRSGGVVPPNMKRRHRHTASAVHISCGFHCTSPTSHPPLDSGLTSRASLFVFCRTTKYLAIFI